MKKTGRQGDGATGRKRIPPPVAPSPRRPVLPAEGPPPFGGSWKTLYTIVLVNLAVLTVLFYLFTRYFG